MTESKVEGYWWSKYDPHYPMPVPNVLSDEDATSIYNLIVAKEKIAEKYGYRGFSSSRITNEMLGSHEFKLDDWIWPADFAKHYVLDHKVRPTDEFLAFIGYENDGITKAVLKTKNDYNHIDAVTATTVAGLSRTIDSRILSEVLSLPIRN